MLRSLLFIFLSLSFSCTGLKIIKNANSYDVQYHSFQQGGRTITVIQQNLLGQKPYIQNLHQLVENQRISGSQIIQEEFNYVLPDSTDLRKVRKLYGYLPTTGSYDLLAEDLLKDRYQLSVEQYAEADLATISIRAKKIVQVYESQYNTIPLTQEDLNTHISSPIKNSLPAKERKEVIKQIRLEYFDKSLEKYPNKNLCLIYDEKLGSLSKIFKEQIQERTTYKKHSTKKKSGFIQPITADSLRKISDTHIRYNGWIDEMNAYLHFKVALIENAELFILDPVGDEKFDFIPNSNQRLKFQVNYRGLAGGFSYTPPFFTSNQDRDIKGKSSGYDLDFSIIRTHWFHNFRTRRIKGFYLDNTADFLPQWQFGDPYIQKNQLRYRAFEGATGYKFNPKFSLRALSTQTERQLKSAGSGMVISHYRYFQTQDAADTLLPVQIKQSDNIEIGLNYGYFHTFVIHKSIYISAGIAPGFGLVYSWLQKLEEEQLIRDQDYGVLFRIDGRIGIGINGERYFGGLYTQFASGAFIEEKDIYNTSSRQSLQFFVGFRFNPPRAMRMVKF